MNRRSVLFGLLLALACKGDLKTDPSQDPAAIAILQGNQQEGEVGSPLPVPPSVLITTGTGSPAAGVAVTFAIVEGGGTAGQTSVITGPDGVAVAGIWVLGTTSGPNRLSATAAGLAGSPVLFSATARPGPPAQAQLVTPPPASVGSGALFSPAPAVQLQDAYGNPDGIAGASVTVSIAQGTGATLAGSTTALTDATGTASFTNLRLQGAVGDYVLSFSSPPLLPVSSTTHLAPGTAVTVTGQAGNNQSANVGTSVAVNPAVLVRDVSGNPVAGVPVSFAVALGGGLVAGGATTTNQLGIAASGSWTLGPGAGENRLTATVTGLPPVTFVATGTILPPGPPASITKVSGDNQTATAGAAVAESLVVQVKDANGLALPAVNVLWSVQSGGGSLSSVSVVTDAAGLSRVRWTLGAVAGLNTVRASIAGFNATFTATGQAGVGAVLTKLGGDNQTAPVGTTLPIDPSVRVTDQGGNPVAGVTVSFSIGSGGGTIAIAQSATNGAGVASGGNWTLGPSVGPNTLNVTAAGLTGSPATFTATGTILPPGPPAAIIKVSGDGQTSVAGEVAPESLVVQVRDANGAGIPGITVAWSVLSGAGSVSSPSSVTTAGGLAAVAWTLGTAAGSNTTRASASGFNVTFSGTGVAGPPASLTKQAGDNQTAPVNSPLSINPSVRLTDANGNPASGVVVSFTVATGGGSIANAQGTSNGQGVASGGAWTLGPIAGPNTLTAAVAGLTGSPATFSATATAQQPGPPAAMVKQSGDGQSAIAGEAAAESLVVQVQDANGIGVPGVTVMWTVLTGGGSVSSASIVTDAGGLAAIEWTLGTVDGQNSVRASGGGFNTTFSATGVAGPPATLTRSSGNNQTAPAGSPVAVNPTVLVQDANGNPVSAVTVDFSITAGGGTIQSSSAQTSDQGLASGGTWTLGGTPGANQLTATVPGLAGSPLDFAATGTPTTGPPAALVIVSGDNQTDTAGNVLAESLVVKLTDGGGIGVPGATVSWAVTGGGGAISSPSVITDLAGLAAVRLTLGTVAGSNTVEASAAGFIQTFAATATPGAASRLTIVTQPGSGQSGVILNPQPAVQLLDANGNPVAQSGVSISAAIASGGGTLSGPTAVLTDGAGEAQFVDLSISGLVGSRTLTFSAAGLTGALSTPLSIGAGPAAILAKQVGDNQSALVGTPVAINPRVGVTDASGNPVPGVTVGFSVSTGGGTIESGSSVTTPLGRATGGQWTLGPVAGANTLTATVAGLTGSPAIFTATGTSSTGAPASIAKVDGDNQTAIAGQLTTDSLVVQVLDANGTGVPGIAVSWTILSGGGTLSSASGTTDATGLAAVTWTLGVGAGTNTARATAAGFNTTFTATGVAGPATTLSKQSGDNQSAQVNSPVAIDPSVRVADINGNPVSGIAVNFTVIGGSGTIAVGVSFSDALGIASGGNWTLGPNPGSNSLRASAAGLSGSPALFSATATSAPNTRIPLIDMGAATYFGFPGGLYPNGNAVPASHATAGAARARNIRPRSFNGNLNANGKFVLLSIGLSNTTMEWCTGVVAQPCNSWSFMGQAAADGAVNHQRMVVANGARPGQEADTWDSPTDFNYDLVRDNVLLPQGLSEKQVEVIWLKVVTGNPATSLPSNQADAAQLVTHYGNILRALKVRYPNLEMVFFSSRIYAGYATLPLNPEPFAFESGFSVKWVIEAQIDQMANGGTIVDPRAGNLNFNSVAPWIGWGPYLWADGQNPRSDGLRWLISDYEIDHTHPAIPGQTKVAGMLLSFFKTDPRAACWFLAGQTCP